MADDTNDPAGDAAGGPTSVLQGAVPSFRSAVGWSFVLSIGQQVMGIAVSMVLAALLGPEVFGTAVIALVFVGFTQLILLSGLMPALIQRPDLTPRHMSTGFWLGLVAGVLLAAACVALSGPWAALNGVAELQPVIIALSLLLPITALTVVPEAWLRRHLRFKQLALRTNVSVLVGGAAGICAALLGAGVWSLVIQQLVTALVALVVLWTVSDWRPSLVVGRAEAADLAPFTAMSSLSAVGSFVNNQGDAMIIGVFFGPVAVGLYRFGTRMVMAIVEVVARSLQGVSLPELSRNQFDPAAIRARMESLVSLSMSVAGPVLGILFAVSPWLLRLIGPEWSGAVTPLRILCVAGVLRVFATFSGPLLQALDRTRLLASFVWVGAALSALFFLTAGVLLEGRGTAVEVNGMAAANAALLAVLAVLNSWIMTRFAAVPVRAQLRIVGVPLLSGVVAVVVGAVLELSGLLVSANHLVALLAAGVLCTVPAGLVLLADDSARQMLRRVGARGRAASRG